MNGFSRYLLSMLLLVLAGIASAEIETVTWLHTDHLGSPLMARDAQGNTLWQEDYSPWGERLNAPPANRADIGYTGHYEEADIGLAYAQARWYDPAVGRFLSPDPVTMDKGGDSHFNRYVYANSNPYLYLDPDGRDPATVAVVVLVVTHWERNRFNESFDKKSFIPRSDISSTHQLGGQIDNLKWLSEDGKSEYVTLGKDGEIVTDVMNMGTYNFIRAPRRDDSFAMKVLTGAGHALTDMVLWVPLGNRPTDISLESNPATRLYGLGKAGIGKAFGGEIDE